MLTTVFGRRGSGKTTLIRAMIPAMKKPVVIVDMLGNFDPDSPEGIKWTKEQPQVNYEEWVQTESFLDALYEIESFHKNPKEHTGFIVVRDGDMNRAVDYLCSALWAIRGGTLVLDEVDAIQVKDAPCFNEAVRYGRNKGIDLITGCRRPAEISRNVTAGSDLAYCLTTQEPRDIDYYKDFLGEELALALKDLPPHHGIYRDFLKQTTGFFRTDITGKVSLLGGKSVVKPAPKVSDLKKPIDKTKVAPKTESIDLSH